MVMIMVIMKETIHDDDVCVPSLVHPPPSAHSPHSPPTMGSNNWDKHRRNRRETNPEARNWDHQRLNICTNTLTHKHTYTKSQAHTRKLTHRHTHRHTKKKTNKQRVGATIKHTHLLLQESDEFLALRQLHLSVCVCVCVCPRTSSAPP
jgi:hypothetical protein